MNFSGGEVRLPDGDLVKIQAGQLHFDAPEIRSDTQITTAPVNYATSMGADNQSWMSALPLVPTAAAPFRGGLFHGVIPSSVVVTNATGTQTFVAGTDYKYNSEFGQVANLSGKLGAAGSGLIRVSYRYAMQRLDLVEVLPDGTVTIKKGTSAITAPALPSPDEGATALAGVYIYTLDGPRDSGFTIQTRDINMIDPAPAVQPINPGAIAKTLAKLKAGQDVNIAWFGDSITAGAEVAAPVGDRSKFYTGIITNTLKKRFPNAHITETAAYQGGLSAEFNGGVFDNKVAKVADSGKKIDLLVIALGMNDPAKPISNFTTPMKSFIEQAKARGMEVMLVTTMPYDPLIEKRYSFTPKAQVVQATRDLGAQENVAVADVYQAWMNLPSQGMPVWSQLHNWVQHPGENGQKIYADTILRFFN